MLNGTCQVNSIKFFNFSRVGILQPSKEKSGQGLISPPCPLPLKSAGCDYSAKWRRFSVSVPPLVGQERA